MVRSAYSAPEFKARFERIQDALINKGLLLARDRREERDSRFARMYLLLPPVVAEALPPLPVKSEPVGTLPAFCDWTEVAMEFLRADLLAPRRGAARSASAPWSSLFPAAVVENGILRMNQQERPTLEALRAAIFKNWLGIGSIKQHRGHNAGFLDPLDLNDESDLRAHPIRIRYIQSRDYILNSIPPGHGVRSAQLFEAFAMLQCSMADDAHAAFLESGARLGFLAAANVGEQQLLVPNSHARDMESACTFVHWQDADKGVTASLNAVTFVELLTIAPISTFVIKGGKLHATPSLKWIGRERQTLQGITAIQALLQRSSVYREAFDTVAEREGKWVVQDNVTVLKLGGSDIEAVLLAEYGRDSATPRLAALGAGWYALCRNDLQEVLAFAKQKGYKPKIMPPSLNKEGAGTKKEVLK